MKYFFFLLLFTSCTTSRLSSQMNEKKLFISMERDTKLKPGSCYMSERIGNDAIIPIDSQDYILEIVNPKIEKYLSKITAEELEGYDPEVASYQIQIMPAFVKYKFFNERAAEFKNNKDIIGFAVCLIESPPQYRKVSKEDLLNKNTQIKRYKINEKAKIYKMPVEEKPKTLTKNQYYLRAGKWSPLEEIRY